MSIRNTTTQHGTLNTYSRTSRRQLNTGAVKAEKPTTGNGASSGNSAASSSAGRTDKVALSDEAQKVEKTSVSDKPPTGSDIDTEAVTANPDKVARNQQVTEGYREISQGLDETINPPGSPDGGVNWASHAVWASKQAGEGIKGKGLPSVGADQVPGALSDGNTRVFKDIGPDMQDFSKQFSKDDKVDEAKFNEWADKRFTGENAGLKREAFESYYKARFEQDQKKKQEMVLYGNAKIGEYEQTVLDPDIDKAMTPTGLTGLAGRGLLNNSPVDWVTGQNRVRELATQGVPGLTDPMSLSHPDGQGGTKKVNLSEDVATLPPDTLKTIDDPKLRAAMEKYGVNPDQANGGSTAARDWSEYNDRMGWIVQHFRANQMNREMITKDPQPDISVDMPRTGGKGLTDSPLPRSNEDQQSAFLSAFMANYAA